jgi:CubicO group peptidase (beta-lactamase class C family)
VVAIFTVVAATVCALAIPPVRPARAATSSEGFASADAAMRARIRADHLDGGALVVRRAAQVLHDKTFGSWTMNAVVPIASASKWLTAATLMTFVDEGRLQLDDPVSTYLPGFDGAKQAITVRMLLSHTHGLRSPGCEGDPTTDLGACAREVADGPAPAWRPGSEFHYGGTGFVVAGAIVERLSGTSFEQAFETRVADPVGMATTAFDGSVSSRGRHRKASTRNPAPAGSAVSSTADYARFVAMLAAGGTARGERVLSEASVAEIERDQVAGIDTRHDGAVQITGIPTYGLGVWRDEVASDDAIQVVSGSGALGFYPWIDRVHGTYGIVSVVDQSGPDHAVPLSQRIARRCWTVAADRA